MAHSPSRRNFLKTSAAAGLAMAGARSAEAAASSPDGLRMAIIGVKGRGRSHMGGFEKNLVALCDVDQKILEQTASKFESDKGRKLDTYTDYRELLRRADIDAVGIATPNHTHTPIAIAAIQAGKHVYVEKPVSHNVWEGAQLVAAARQKGAVVQCGTQSRSSRCLQESVAWVQSGEFGKIEYVVGTCYKPRQAIGQLDKPLNIPSSIDYDLWCGPADKVDLYRPKLHYDWHWDYNTGAGDLGNQGIHQMDIARWFLGEQTLAPRTLSIGARLGYDDAANSANTQTVLLDFAKAPLLFETRGLPRSKAAQSDWSKGMERYRGSGIGVLVQCEGGLVFAPASYGDVWAWDRSGREVKHWRGGGNHFRNFLEAAAAGDPSRLNTDVAEGHLSSALCHLGNVSHHLGEKRTAGDIADAVKTNELMANSFDRMASHLRANDVDIDSQPALVMGGVLEIDPATGETSTTGAAKQPLWKRVGRPGHEIPDLASA